MSKYLSGSKWHQYLSSACLHELLGKKIVFCAIYTLCWNPGEQFCWLMTHPASGDNGWKSFQAGICCPLAALCSVYQCKRRNSGLMDYNRLLETVSLPLFRIRICEEESKETTKAPMLWDVHGPTEQDTLNICSWPMLLLWSPLYAMINFMYSLYSTFFSKHLHFLCSVLYGFCCSIGILGILCSGKPGRGYQG